MGNPMKLSADGKLIYAKANKSMQANALTVANRGGSRVVVVAGQGEGGGQVDVLDNNGNVPLSVVLPAPKYQNSSGPFAAAQFASYQFANTQRSCDAIALVECWGVATSPLDPSKVIVSCGTGIEPPEGSPTDNICRDDPRTIWRSYTVMVDVNDGSVAWISL